MSENRGAEAVVVLVVAGVVAAAVWISTLPGRNWGLKLLGVLSGGKDL